MESSLNLNTLATSLPTPYQNAETELVNNFKAAALSITTLYRSSRNASKRAYNAGYAAACNDLLMMIQQGVSVGGIDTSGSGSSAESDGMTIGKVMDWIEARMEAIKAREEEEEEEEEKEKERERGRSTAATAAPAPKPDAKSAKAQTVPSVPSRTTREQNTTLQTTQTTRLHGQGTSSQPSSPSPPPAALRQTQRTSKQRAVAKTDSTTPTALEFPSQHQFPSPEMPSSPMAMSIADVAAGTKRRHAVMMMLDSPSSVSGGSSAPSPVSGAASATSLRRRTRSSRNAASLVQNQNFNLGEAMDVEEDGRERKRVARR